LETFNEFRPRVMTGTSMGMSSSSATPRRCCQELNFESKRERERERAREREREKRKRVREREREREKKRKREREVSVLDIVDDKHVVVVNNDVREHKHFCKGLPTFIFFYQNITMLLQCNVM
jgi:hypothetical protein